MNLEAFTCRVAGCGGPRSGVCINSLPFDECPDVIPVADEEEQAPPEQAAKPPVPESVKTPGGRSLDTAACDALLRQRGGTLIGIVAGPEVGKTTMIGTMYELIHRGRMPAFGFAGSETLRGYEERTHLARISSNLDKADTPRTRLEAKLDFTHLRLATDHGIRDVYFSDRSGEHFDIALGKPGDFSTFAELQRADTILMMVDLEQLRLTPQPVMSWVRRMFMALEQHGLIMGKPFTLVGTKADLLADEEDRKEAVARFEALREDLGKRSTGGIEPRSFIVSSRAPKGTKDVGKGLAELLADIFAKPEVPGFSLGVAVPASPSELDALMRIPRRRFA
jgi:hypothetical protein